MTVEKLRFNLGNTNYDVPTKEYVDDLVSNGNINISNAVNYSDTPIGTIIAYMGTTAPRDYLICNGTIYNITDYKELADFINVQFGSYNKFGGNGTTTFAVPDLRGEFLRGSGTNSHTNQGNGANVGVHQNGTVHTNFSFRMDASNYYFQSQGNIGWHTPYNADYYEITKLYENTGSAVRAPVEYTNNLVGDYTSRPTNTSVLYCIKYTTSVLSIPENNFSTTEQKIGTWIDGKPLYQKTIETTTTNTENIVDKIVSLPEEVYVRSLEGYVETINAPIPINFNWESMNYISTYFRFIEHGIKMKQANYCSLPCVLTIQYTKTTD